MATYINFKELRRREVEDIDYRIRCRQGRTGILIMAPHGGNIEPGTSRIADAIAGTEHAFYAYEGLKTGRNSRLHITSRRFDEPAGCRLAADADKVLTIHGCSDVESLVFVGGMDRALAANVWKALARDAFHLKESPRIPGKHPQNICNRCRSGMGVQLEISAGLRKRMFVYRPDRERLQTQVFYSFVHALKSVLANFQSP